MEVKVGKRYRVGRRIGGGSFGEIYHGIDLISGEEIAIKLESSETRHPQLEYESRVYNFVSDGSMGIPNIRMFERGFGYSALVMDLLGPSLEDLFNYCHRSFSYKTIFMLAWQMIARVAYVHGKSFLHRDIKPENFLLGTGRRANIVNLIDFGLSKKYRDFNSHRHNPRKTHKSLVGTARYASVNTHFGIEQSRRDDLESLGYVLVYFAKGHLPWQGLRATTKKQKYDRILQRKLCITTDILCEGLPSQFVAYMGYVRSLQYDQRPDYVYLEQLFKNLSEQLNYTNDYLFDWSIYRYTKTLVAEERKKPIEPIIASRENPPLTEQKRKEREQERELERHFTMFRNIKALTLKKFPNSFHFYIPGDTHNPFTDEILAQTVKNENLVTIYPERYLLAIDQGIAKMRRRTEQLKEQADKRRAEFKKEEEQRKIEQYQWGPRPGANYIAHCHTGDQLLPPSNKLNRKDVLYKGRRNGHESVHDIKKNTKKLQF
ncbi:hypothetical protein NCAS_0A01090 [Naumovozyma castellii]|uniref:non-specific serine/threonine protein kinase n=1 Tax=Naumovozyma castellii TaxID=27288 RepID=G0V5D3_NAUCA|nr:hypothetical protein NCAS_0A01090 [Naumovozyma castellii CBS 4309]CCC66669.1 hypothetical protein NCAS_0A01090 [Naumovozyma castellii CBS 4309]